MPKVSHMFYLGIDPGENGAAALLDSTGKIRDSVRFGKHTESELAGWFRNVGRSMPVAALEKVRSSPQMGVTSSFTFGWNFGLVRGFLAACAISFEDVTPQVWQKGLRIPPKNKKTEDQGQFKRRLREFAHQKWPGMEHLITADLADALLIAEWLRREQR
jgi:hypothetical protein